MIILRDPDEISLMDASYKIALERQMPEPPNQCVLDLAFFYLNSKPQSIPPYVLTVLCLYYWKWSKRN